MNLLRVLICLLVVSCLSATADNSEANPTRNDQHFVEFLGGFHGELVKLHLDGTLIFSERLYTKGGNVLAKYIEIKSSKQAANLKIEVSAWRPKTAEAHSENDAFGPLLPGPQAHGKLRQSVNVDWAKGFLVTFKINKDGNLEMQQFNKWPERY